MFVCDCPTCGRRELRGPRSLRSFPTPHGVIWTSVCRGCGATVTVVDKRRAEPVSTPQAA